MELIIALVIAMFVFAIIKAVFRFHAWLSPESDSTYRNKLDSAVEKLDRLSLFQIAQGILTRLVIRVENLSSLRLRFYVIFGAAALILNGTIFSMALMFAMATHHESISAAAAVIEPMLQVDGGLLQYIGMNTLVSLLGAVFDFLSLMITWALLKRAVKAESGLSLVGHLGADLVIAALACMWAYAILALTFIRYYEMLLPVVSAFSSGSPVLHVTETLWATLDANPVLWYVVISLGISAALPTIIYLVALTPYIGLRKIPKTIQLFLSRILFTLTTDNAPVMKQLETFVSSVGALLSAVIALLKLLPA